MDDVSAAQALTYAGRSTEARESMAELVARAEQSASPSASSWAWYVAGEVRAETDVEGALVAYSAAIEWGEKADSRLVVMLARSSSVALAACSGVPTAALEQFRQILEQWERMGNELAEWWVLRYLVVLLDRLGAARDAAVLAGALSTSDRHASFGPFETALVHIGERLGASATEQALAEGAALTHSAAVAHARSAIAAAQQRRHRA